MLTKIYQKIKEYNTIIIHRHSRPDGDALGAQLGLKKGIELTYPEKRVYAVGDTSQRFDWMGKMDEVSDDIYNNALVIVLDSGADYLISDDRWKLGHFIIKIDHHHPQGNYGNLQYVDTKAESTSGIITKYFLKKRYKMNDEIASLLFTGICTDSGRFRHSTTTHTTFTLASELMKYNLDLDYIFNNIYIDKLANVKTKAKLIEKFIVKPCGLAYLINTKEDIKELGLDVNDVTRGVVNIMSGIEEISTWANFAEDVDGKVYCELRTRDKNVLEVATKFGGGGHLRAAGMTLPNKTMINDVLHDLEKVAKGE